MSKMNRTELVKRCAALASAWNDIYNSDTAFSIGCDLMGQKVTMQTRWETFRELFPETPTSSKRNCTSYPWEATVTVEGVEVYVLLTEAEKEAE